MQMNLNSQVKQQRPSTHKTAGKKVPNKGVVTLGKHETYMNKKIEKRGSDYVVAIKPRNIKQEC